MPPTTDTAKNVYAALSLGEVKNVMILTLYYSPSVYCE